MTAAQYNCSMVVDMIDLSVVRETPGQSRLLLALGLRKKKA